MPLPHANGIFFSSERPLGSFSSGLATATLRVRNRGTPDFAGHLKRAFIELFALYGNGFFDCSATANVIVKSDLNHRFSVFYGQSFSPNRDYKMSPTYTVRNLGDVAGIKTNYTLNDFEEVFFHWFEDSEVSLLEIINIVFIISRFMGNYQRDQTVGQALTRLF